MSPDRGYKDYFVSWREFLGTIGDGKTSWLKHDIKYFIEELKEELIKLIPLN